MRLRYCIFLLNFLLPVYLISQNVVQNNAFKAGEKLTYKLTYNNAFGEVYAGNATVEVREDTVGEKPGFQIVGIGETNTFFDFFYEVRDKFESEIDASTLQPHSFIRTTREGNFSYDDTVFFDRQKDTAVSSRKSKPIPNDVFDIVSAVYFMRTLTLDDFGTDSTYYLNFFLDDSVYATQIKYIGQGAIKSEWGWLSCLKVKPMMAIGEVFTSKYPMIVWITDDENHIPVLGESEIVVGSVRMELSGFEGLKNPFIKPLTKQEMKRFK
jgi:hypothetical protein